MAYPVSVNVEPALANRNRLTTAFRLILAIPHILLVGGVGTAGGEGGLLGAVVFFLRRRELVHDRDGGRVPAVLADVIARQSGSLISASSSR